MADTAGASDLVFGLFWLLGYQFSPRLADVGETNFWRLDPAADYGALNTIARSRINTRLIIRNWEHPVEDFAGQMRFAGSYRLAQCQGLRTLLQHQELIHRYLLDCLL